MKPGPLTTAGTYRVGAGVTGGSVDGGIVGITLGAGVMRPLAIATSEALGPGDVPDVAGTPLAGGLAVAREAIGCAPRAWMKK